MARLFNIEVFNQTISGDANAPIYYSNREQQATLGSADILYAQIIVEGLTDITGTVTVLYQTSNTSNEDEWVDTSKTVGVTPGGLTSTSLPKNTILTIDNTTTLGAFGRFKITYNKNSMATVRLIVCGRAN
jgi:hypothetical protein